MTANEVITLILASFTFGAVYTATIVAIVVAITKKKWPPVAWWLFLVILGQPLTLRHVSCND